MTAKRVVLLITQRTFWHLAALPAFGQFGKGRTGGKVTWGWEGCLDRDQHPHLPCDPSWVGSISYFLTWMKPRVLLCVSVCQGGREKGGAFLLLSIWAAQEPRRTLRGGEHHLPDGETEARHQPSTSQHWLTGERQCSLNPTGHRAQTHSQLQTIPRAGGCKWQSPTGVARMWLGAAPGQCWLSLGQLAMVQLVPARLFINQGPFFAVARTALGPPWEQGALPSHGVYRLK